MTVDEVAVDDVAAADTRRLAYRTFAMLGVVAVPVAVVGWLVAGLPGALSALVGVAFVAILFGGSALLLAVVLRHRPRWAAGVLIGGAFARMVFYAAVLLGLTQVSWVHRPSVAVATAVATAITLGYEMRALSRMPRLYHLDPDARVTQPVPSATRS